MKLEVWGKDGKERISPIKWGGAGVAQSVVYFGHRKRNLNSTSSWMSGKSASRVVQPCARWNDGANK